jgi:uncharacterized protein
MTLSFHRLALMCAAAALLGGSAHGTRLSAQQSAASFRVGSAAAMPGTTSYGAIAIAAGVDSATSIPVAVIRGIKPGPIVAFVSGAHGTEYTSIIAMQRLIARIDATQLSGTVIVAPLLNVASFLQMTPHLNPVDRKSMNGMYPGDVAGTQTQRVLAAVTEQIVAPADVVVDLHGGDLDEDLRPYSYWYRGGRADQDSAGLKLALAFGLDHIIVADADPAVGRSLSGQALQRGKTVLVAEAGRSGTATPADLALLVNGSLNVLGALHMLPRTIKPVKHPVWLAGAGRRIAAESEGVFTAAVARDTKVKTGQVLGHTTDFLGRTTGTIVSPIDGLVTFIRGVPSMARGATLVNVAPILSAPAPWALPGK